MVRYRGNLSGDSTAYCYKLFFEFSPRVCHYYCFKVRAENGFGFFLWWRRWRGSYWAGVTRVDTHTRVWRWAVVMREFRVDDDFVVVVVLIFEVDFVCLVWRWIVLIAFQWDHFLKALSTKRTWSYFYLRWYVVQHNAERVEWEWYNTAFMDKTLKGVYTQQNYRYYWKDIDRTKESWKGAMEYNTAFMET